MKKILTTILISVFFFASNSMASENILGFGLTIHFGGGPKTKTNMSAFAQRNSDEFEFESSQQIGLTTFGKGFMRAEVPLITWNETSHPGILYNGGTGQQFYNLLAKASEGDEESELNSLDYLIVIGAIATGGVVIALANKDGSDKSTPATTAETTETETKTKPKTKPTPAPTPTPTPTPEPEPTPTDPPPPTDDPDL